MDASAIHDLSGFLPTIPISASVQLPTYFVIVSLDFCICLLWLVRRTEERGLRRNSALDLAMALMIGGLIGSRLTHVFFEEPHYYLENPARILHVWQGGFVWYGGAIIGAGSALLLARWRQLPLNTWLDVFAPVAALGYGIGRVACLLEGCCFGAVCELGSGYRFRYPTQAFAVIWELAVVMILLFVERRGEHPDTFLNTLLGARLGARSTAWLRHHGSLFTLWMVLHACGRIVMESFRADPRGPEPWGLSLATWLSLGLLILAGVRSRGRRV